MTDRIAPVEIILTRAEGPTAECGSVKFTDTVISYRKTDAEEWTPVVIDRALGVSLWQRADAQLRSWSFTAPSTGGYDKCDFKVTFADGEMYEGRYDLKRGDGASIGGHIQEFCRFNAGLARPTHLTQQQYKRFLDTCDSAEVEAFKGFLLKYDLGPEKVGAFG